MTTPSLPDALRACIEAANMVFGTADEPMATGAAYRCAALIRKHGPALEALLRERDELQSVCLELAKDAQRYRLLRKSRLARRIDFADAETMEELDAAVDALAGPNGAAGDVRPVSLGDSP